MATGSGATALAVTYPLDLFTPMACAHPAVDPTAWVNALGGGPAQRAVARALSKDLGEEFTPIGSAGAARKTAKHISELVRQLEVGQTWEPPTHDPLWADTRPTSLEQARERLGEIVEAHTEMRATTTHAALAPPTAHDAAVSPRDLLSSFERMHKSKEGEGRLGKASQAQRLADHVTSALVLQPLQDPDLIAAENILGSATSRGVGMAAELRRMSTLPRLGQPHAARALIASAGVRLDDDAQGPLPVNIVLARKAALAAIHATATLAVGGPAGRRLTPEVKAKIVSFSENLLAGTIELDVTVVLLGGLAPASKRAIAGAEDAEGTWGKLCDKANIEKALKLAFSMLAMVHTPLLDMTAGAADDFGLGAMVAEAQHLHVSRLQKTLERALAECARAFAAYRTSLDAPTPCLLAAMDEAITTDLIPLAHEQTTVKCSEEAGARAAAAYLEKHGGGAAKGAKGADSVEVAGMRRTIEAMQKQLNSLTAAKRTIPGEKLGDTRATARTIAPARPHARMPARPHDRTFA